MGGGVSHLQSPSQCVCAPIPLPPTSQLLDAGPGGEAPGGEAAAPSDPGETDPDPERPDRALLLHPEYVSAFLDGTKRIDIRGKPSAHAGPIYLCETRTGLVRGRAVVRPSRDLTPEEKQEHNEVLTTKLKYKTAYAVPVEAVVPLEHPWVLPGSARSGHTLWSLRSPMWSLHERWGLDAGAAEATVAPERAGATEAEEAAAGAEGEGEAHTANEEDDAAPGGGPDAKEPEEGAAPLAEAGLGKENPPPKRVR